MDDPNLVNSTSVVVDQKGKMTSVSPPERTIVLGVVNTAGMKNPNVNRKRRWDQPPEEISDMMPCAKKVHLSDPSVMEIESPQTTSCNIYDRISEPYISNQCDILNYNESETGHGEVALHEENTMPMDVPSNEISDRMSATAEDNCLSVTCSEHNECASKVPNESDLEFSDSVSDEMVCSRSELRLGLSNAHGSTNIPSKSVSDNSKVVVNEDKNNSITILRVQSNELQRIMSSYDESSTDSEKSDSGNGSVGNIALPLSSTTDDSRLSEVSEGHKNNKLINEDTDIRNETLLNVPSNVQMSERMISDELNYKDNSDKISLLVSTGEKSHFNLPLHQKNEVDTFNDISKLDIHDPMSIKTSESPINIPNIREEKVLSNETMEENLGYNKPESISCESQSPKEQIVDDYNETIVEAKCAINNEESTITHVNLNMENLQGENNEVGNSPVEQDLAMTDKWPINENNEPYNPSTPEQIVNRHSDSVEMVIPQGNTKESSEHFIRTVASPVREDYKFDNTGTKILSNIFSEAPLLTNDESLSSKIFSKKEIEDPSYAEVPLQIKSPYDMNITKLSNEIDETTEYVTENKEENIERSHFGKLDAIKEVEIVDSNLDDENRNNLKSEIESSLICETKEIKVNEFSEDSNANDKNNDIDVFIKDRILKPSENLTDVEKVAYMIDRTKGKELNFSNQNDISKKPSQVMLLNSFSESNVEEPGLILSNEINVVEETSKVNKDQIQTSSTLGESEKSSIVLSSSNIDPEVMEVIFGSTKSTTELVDTGSEEECSSASDTSKVANMISSDPSDNIFFDGKGGFAMDIPESNAQLDKMDDTSEMSEPVLLETRFKEIIEEQNTVTSIEQEVLDEQSFSSNEETGTVQTLNIELDDGSKELNTDKSNNLTINYTSTSTCELEVEEIPELQDSPENCDVFNSLPSVSDQQLVTSEEIYSASEIPVDAKCMSNILPPITIAEKTQVDVSGVVKSSPRKTECEPLSVSKAYASEEASSDNNQYTSVGEMLNIVNERSFSGTLPEVSKEELEDISEECISVSSTKHLEDPEDKLSQPSAQCDDFPKMPESNLVEGTIISNAPDEITEELSDKYLDDEQGDMGLKAEESESPALGASETASVDLSPCEPTICEVFSESKDFPEQINANESVIILSEEANLEPVDSSIVLVEDEALTDDGSKSNTELTPGLHSPVESISGTSFGPVANNIIEDRCKTITEDIESFDVVEEVVTCESPTSDKILENEIDELIDDDDDDDDEDQGRSPSAASEETLETVQENSNQLEAVIENDTSDLKVSDIDNQNEVFIESEVCIKSENSLSGISGIGICESTTMRCDALINSISNKFPPVKIDGEVTVNSIMKSELPFVEDMEVDESPKEIEPSLTTNKLGEPSFSAVINTVKSESKVLNTVTSSNIPLLKTVSSPFVQTVNETANLQTEGINRVDSTPSVESGIISSKLEPITLKLYKDNLSIKTDDLDSPKRHKSPKLSSELRNQHSPHARSSEIKLSPQSKQLEFTLKIAKDANTNIPRATMSPKSNMSPNSSWKLDSSSLSPHSPEAALSPLKLKISKPVSPSTPSKEIPIRVQTNQQSIFENKSDLYNIKDEIRSADSMLLPKQNIEISSVLKKMMGDKPEMKSEGSILEKVLSISSVPTTPTLVKKRGRPRKVLTPQSDIIIRGGNPINHSPTSGTDYDTPGDGNDQGASRHVRSCRARTQPIVVKTRRPRGGGRGGGRGGARGVGRPITSEKEAEKIQERLSEYEKAELAKIEARKEKLRLDRIAKNEAKLAKKLAKKLKDEERRKRLAAEKAEKAAAAAPQVFEEETRMSAPDSRGHTPAPALARFNQNSLATQQQSGKGKGELREQALEAVAMWNSNLNRERKEERRCSLDLQTFTVHYPKTARERMIRPALKPGLYPVPVIPGQFSDYYKTYTPTELMYFPLNTVMYGPLKPNERRVNHSDGSDSSSSSSDDSSGSSSSGSDTEDEESVSKECKICNGEKKSNNDSHPEILLQCSQCKGLCHPTCQEITPEMLPHIKKYSWHCSNCKKCMQCKNGTKDDKMLFCDLCDRGYHLHCVGLKKSPEGRWHCSVCSFCTVCGSKDPGGVEWHYEYNTTDKGVRLYQRTLCVPCSKN